jgi:hypothetical protein
LGHNNKKNKLPVYTAQCSACAHRQEYIRKIADRHNTPLCEECGAATGLAITTVMVPCMAISESMHVVSPIDGAVLRCKSDYEAHMKKHNVRPSSEFEGVKKEEKGLDKEKLREAASRAYDALMPNS